MMGAGRHADPTRSCAGRISRARGAVRRWDRGIRSAGRAGRGRLASRRGRRAESGARLSRHLRRRGTEGAQPTTAVELFFDLVFVFAVTQLSHLIIADLTVAAVARAGFLLLIVWWAWIYTTWMVNWFDPAAPAVRAVLVGGMLASLLGRAPHGL